MTTPPGELPLASIQGSAEPKGFLRLTLFFSLAALVVLPQFWLAGAALSQAAIRAELWAHPLVAFELLAALSFWTLLFCWPLYRLFRSAMYLRHVKIDNEFVSVTDRRPSGTSAWQEPLTAYLGVAHHIRTSLSGVRHEMILVHPNQARSVFLSVAEHISDKDYRAALDLLTLPPVPASLIYGLQAKTQAEQPSPARPQPFPAAA